MHACQGMTLFLLILLILLLLLQALWWRVASAARFGSQPCSGAAAPPQPALTFWSHVSAEAAQTGLVGVDAPAASLEASAVVGVY